MKILAKLLSGFIAVAILCAVVGDDAIMQVTDLNSSIRGHAD